MTIYPSSFIHARLAIEKGKKNDKDEVTKRDAKSIIYEDVPEEMTRTVSSFFVIHVLLLTQKYWVTARTTDTLFASYPMFLKAKIILTLNFLFNFQTSTSDPRCNLRTNQKYFYNITLPQPPPEFEVSWPFSAFYNSFFLFDRWYEFRINTKSYIFK